MASFSKANIHCMSSTTTVEKSDVLKVEVPIKKLVYIVLDVSGSMAGSRLTKALEGIKFIFDECCGNTDHFALVAFNDSVHTVTPHEYRLITTTARDPGTCTASIAIDARIDRDRCARASQTSRAVGGAVVRGGVGDVAYRAKARRGCRAAETMGKNIARAMDRARATASPVADAVARRRRNHSSIGRRRARSRAIHRRGSDGARRVRDARRAVYGVGMDGDEWFRAR